MANARKYWEDRMHALMTVSKLALDASENQNDENQKRQLLEISTALNTEAEDISIMLKISE